MKRSFKRPIGIFGVWKPFGGLSSLGSIFPIDIRTLIAFDKSPSTINDLFVETSSRVRRLSLSTLSSFKTVLRMFESLLECEAIDSGEFDSRSCKYGRSICPRGCDESVRWFDGAFGGFVAFSGIGALDRFVEVERFAARCS